MKTNSIKIEFVFGLEKTGHNATIAYRDSCGALREILRAAITLFGGYSYSEGRGAWVNAGDVFIERCGTLSIVQPQTKSATEDDNLRASITALADVVKVKLSQRAVVVNTSPINSQLL